MRKATLATLSLSIALTGALTGALAGCGMTAPGPAASPGSLPAQVNLEAVEAVRVPRPTLVEKYGDHARAFGELRVPEGEGPFPVAILIHGGCWTKGFATQSYMAPLAAWLAANGVATWNIDWREIGDAGGGWPGTFADWQAAADHLSDLARRYPLDLSRVSTIGHSAGVTGAVWLAMPQDAGGPVGARPALRLRSVIALDGPLELGPWVGTDEQVCGSPAISKFMGGKPAAVPARYAAVDPLQHLPTTDEVISVAAALPPNRDSLLAAFRARGIEATPIVLEGASHFAPVAPGSPPFAHIAPRILAAVKGP